MHDVTRPTASEAVDEIPRWSEWLLELLAAHDQRITFFVTGEFEAALPDVVSAIHKYGHEIGYHSHDHPRIQNTAQLLEQLAASKAFLARYQPRGFRAPWIDLPESCLAPLAASGFRYDSSSLGESFPSERNGIALVPVTTWRYGKQASRPVFGQRISPGLLRQELPIGSGIVCSYLRVFYPWILRRMTARGKHCVFYLHLWQFYRKNGRNYRGMQFVHRFPLRRWLQRMLTNGMQFGRIIDLLEGRLPDKAHCLSIDLEL